MKWSDLSKAVGWSEQKVDYPTMEQVKDAVEAQSAYRLLSWHRFLAQPAGDEQLKIKQLVDKCVETLKRGMEP